MAKSGTVTVKIDDEKIMERMRDMLIQAWDEGRDHGRDNSRDGYCLCTSLDWSETDQCVNPYRD